ncbi:MAG TPA: hypothetical protein VN774_09505, partial [Candidatus Limnocylindrales bacterium]|nr:hypothetical protein [Candidatus Limnocylindrales bacterium]
PTHLLPVHIANQPLLAGRVFLAHVPNIDAFPKFSRRNFKEVFSQLQRLCVEWWSFDLFVPCIRNPPKSSPPQNIFFHVALFST